MSSPGRDENSTAWDSFWNTKAVAGASLVMDGKTETWYDLVWKVGFESWYDIFTRLSPGRKMLEYGCGSAKVSQYMACRGYDCSMLDYSSAGIGLAQAAFRSLGREGCFMIGDINHLELADNQFDIAYSGGVLEFFADVRSPVREVVRVLKPGGLFAVDIVPNKFSVQTLADIERTLAGTVKNLATRRWRQAFRIVRNVETSVSTASLQVYVDCFRAAGLTGLTARCVSPFPALSLGTRGERLYGKLLKRSLGLWRAFNESPGRWTEVLGIAYRIYGVKGKSK